MNSTPRNDLTWMLDELVTIPKVLHAVVISTDGMVIRKSTALPQASAELLAAGASSVYSVAAGMGMHFDGGPVGQVVMEYEDQTCFVASAGQNARLVVLCEQAVDMGLAAYEMSRLVTRIGRFLGSEQRHPVTAASDSPGHGQ